MPCSWKIQNLILQKYCPIKKQSRIVPNVYAQGDSIQIDIKIIYKFTNSVHIRYNYKS